MGTTADVRISIRQPERRTDTDFSPPGQLRAKKSAWPREAIDPETAQVSVARVLDRLAHHMLLEMSGPFRRWARTELTARRYEGDSLGSPWKPRSC
jgi:hypothetical protein